ncbi:MAG TPA: cytochrome c [Gammaproteobacteria bacterium]|nr:cytochrome c [Gammaproteobacteria bacterium]
MNQKWIIARLFLGLLFLAASTGVALAGDPMKGRPLYVEHCSGCHGLNGQPQVAEVPNFKMGQGLMQSDQQMLDFVKRGKLVMPGFKGILTDDQILDIIAHVRTFF